MDEQQPQQQQPEGQNWPSAVHTGSSLGGPQDTPQPAAGVSTPPNGGQVSTTGSDDFVANPSFKASTPTDSDFVDNPNFKKPDPLAFQKGDSALTTTGKFLGNAAEGIGEVGEGAGEGVFKTAAGAADILHLPEQARQFLHHLSGDDEDIPAAAKIGYGGETLAEYLMGDAAIKALPVAQRLETAAKAIKTIEGSPRLVNALKIGARMISLAGLHGAEGGAVQAAQTFVRANGSIEDKAKEAGKEGLETAGIGTALGVPGEAISEGLQKAGQVAGKVKDLSQVAEGAKGTEEIAEELSNRLKSAETQRGVTFEDGINKLKSDLQGQTLDRQDSPVMKKAKELLANPIPADDPTTKLAKEISGDKLDSKTKALLEDAALGGIPQKAEEVAAPKGFLGLTQDAPKKNVAPVTVTPHAPYDIDNLVQMRQAIREAAAGYDYRDPNSYVLRQLNNSIDDAIEKLASKTSNPQALADYKELRANYKTQLHAYDNPVIRNLRDGKMNDAAKAFVGTVNPNSTLPSAGKTSFNIDSLTDAIGADGVKAFGKDVFHNMLRDSVDKSGINPGKFVDSWNRIDDATKQKLFDVNNAKNGLKQLANDAQSGAKLQMLSKAGVLAGAGVVGSSLGAAGAPLLHMGMGVGTMLGLAVAEGGGIAAGRNLLNYLADHPETWNTYVKAGRAAAGGALSTAANVTAKEATDALNRKPAQLKNALSNASGALQ